MLKQSVILLSLLSLLNTAVAETLLTPTEQTEMVAAHNTWRSRVAVPDLQWSSSLADTAQVWANSLKENQGCQMVHSNTEQVGENLYWASPLTYSDGKVELQAISPTEVSNSWGSEKKNYRYKSNSCKAGQVCGHYTQMVWKTTTEMGCGKALCADKSQVWVCHYAPAGNYIGEKPY